MSYLTQLNMKARKDGSRVIRVEPYTLYASNGRKIRQASKAILERPNGDLWEVPFMEKLSLNEAIVLLTFDKIMSERTE